MPFGCIGTRDSPTYRRALYSEQANPLMWIPRTLESLMEILGQGGLVWFARIQVAFDSLVHISKETPGQGLSQQGVSGCLLDSLVHEKYLLLGKKTP